MSRASRAAQFAPFDALNGLQEALREREERHSRIERKQLSEEMCDELAKEMQKIQKGSKIKVNFYFKGHYYDFTGIVSVKNTVLQYLIVDDLKIDFQDIYMISLL